MKKIPVILLIFLVPFISHGQADSSNLDSSNVVCKRNTIENKGLLYMGIHAPDPGTLDEIFQHHNYPELARLYPSLGFGFLTFRNKLVREINFVGYGLDHKTDTATTSVKNFGSGLGLGYCYLNRKKTRMYTIFGLNSAYTTIKVYKNVPASTSFSSYTSSLGKQLEITNWMFSANIATHFAYTITNKKSNARSTIGIRTGYNFPLLRDWETNNVQLEDGPKVNLNRFYAMFILGFDM